MCLLSGVQGAHADAALLALTATLAPWCRYNIGGAVLWSVLFVGAGYLFGNLPFVQHNFTAVVLAIVAVSVLPVIYEIWAARKEEAAELCGEPPASSPGAV